MHGSGSCSSSSRVFLRGKAQRWWKPKKLATPSIFQLVMVEAQRAGDAIDFPAWVRELSACRTESEIEDQYGAHFMSHV